MKKEKRIVEVEGLVESRRYALDKLNEEFREALVESGLSKVDLEKVNIVESPDGVEGDFGFHCAVLAKSLKMRPEEIARALVETLPIAPDGLIKSYLQVGQYLNCKVDFEHYSLETISKVVSMGGEYGKEKVGTGQKVMIDMSSPNIAKRMSVGHLRSTIIGDSLAKVFEHLDFEVVKDNHIGDWGTQFGHLLYGLELWEDYETIAKNPIEELQKLYVRISEMGDAESDLYKGLGKEEAMLRAEAVKNKGREWFRKLENGDSEARKKWKMIVDWSLADFENIYQILGVEFDLVRGESFYEDMLKDTVKLLAETGVLTESKGALVVDMEEDGLRTAIVQKSDGATLYLTRDIATAVYRSEVDKADRMIYVVGDDQKFYFEQFFGVLRKMGLEIGNRSKHVYFGMVRLPEGKMSTRKGRVVLLEDVINEAFERSASLVDQRTWIKDKNEKSELIRKVAVGALKWNDLMADPKRTIIFDWDAMLSLDGNSAPYVQYTFARSCSLLESFSVREIPSNLSLNTEMEKKIIKSISVFPKVVQEVAESYNPSKIAMYIYSLSRLFNTYYHDTPILKEQDRHKRECRLLLTAAVAQTIKVGLELLGIEAPEKM